MPKTQKSISLGNAAADAFLLLDDESVGRVVRALVYFAFHGEKPAVPKPLRATFYAVYAEDCRIRSVRPIRPQSIKFAESPEEAQAEMGEMGEMGAEESRIEEKSSASALEARAPACERIPESLAEEEAAFAEFWNLYPRRDYKAAARRAWGNLFGTLPPKPENLAAILAAVRRDRASDQWREDGGRYIPNAAKWLENRPWEARNDALPPPSPKSNVPAAPDYAAEEKEREKRDLAAAAAALKRMTW